MTFDWEREYGALYRACPSAFWLAPEAGDCKPNVIDVRQVAMEPAQNPSALQMAAYQQSLNGSNALSSQFYCELNGVSMLSKNMYGFGVSRL